jgi:hypothetical protein
MKMSGEQRVHAMIGHFAELAKSPEMMACLPPYHPRQETLSGTLLTPITLPSTGMDQTPLPPSPGALRLVPRRTSPLGDLHFHRAAAALQRPTEPPYVPTYLTPFHPASTNPTPKTRRRRLHSKHLRLHNLHLPGPGLAPRLLVLPRREPDAQHVLPAPRPRGDKACRRVRDRPDRAPARLSPGHYAPG